MDETQGVAVLKGDPKRAIWKLSGPLIVAMLLMSSYNVVNAIWVAGLGSDALAAVGFISPVYMVIMGLGLGIGAGATSAIARRIGADDRTGASNNAVHALLIAIILSAIITVPLVLYAEPIALLFGAGTTAGLAASYGQIIFGGSFFIIFANVAYGVLRAEGDTKRTMYAMVAASVLNMILDPILIYGLGLGIAGAAWGTVISLAAVTVVLLYWFFVKKNLFVCLSWKVFIPSRMRNKRHLNRGSSGQCRVPRNVNPEYYPQPDPGGCCNHRCGGGLFGRVQGFVIWDYPGCCYWDRSRVCCRCSVWGTAL